MRTLVLLALAQVVLLSVHSQTPTVNAIKTSATITIDGNLNEAIWQTTTNVSKTIIGTPNNTGTTFSVSWNNTYLYVGMRVLDANLYNESTQQWDDDAMEIYIDAENDGGTAYSANDRQFMKEWNATTLFEKAGKTTGVLHAWAAVTGGYTVEIAIPWSNIGITNPVAGRIIGFDVANDDDDNGGVRESQRMWAGDGDNWQYPRNFGDLVLQNAADTQAPTAPTNLASSNVTQSSLTLSWTASTDNVAVTGYDIYRNGVKINSALVTTTSYAVTGLTALTAYQFYVNAKDAAGNTSANSAAITVTTPDTQAPTAPTGLAASGITQTDLSLSWTAATDNIAVTGYDVYQNGVKINAATITTTNYAVAGLTAATTYQFYVRAKDAAGNTSANSTTIAVTTLAGPDTQAPTAPTNLSTSNLTQSSLTLNWSAATDNIAVTGYDVYKDGVKLNSTAITTTSYAVSGLTVLTSYQFYVTASDAAGNTSANSNTLTVTTPDTQAPTAPTGLVSSSLTQSSLTLTWTASTDNVAVTGYDVYRNGVKINTTLIATTTYNISGLNAGTAYQFYIMAKDAAGNTSANSSTLSVTTPDAQAPTAPSALTASGTTQTATTLTWSAATDNVAVTGYDVYRNGTKINATVVTTTTYAVTGLTASTAYSFYVQARDAAGNISANSNTVAVTTSAVPTTCSGNGAINFQRWNNVTGTTVASLTSIAAYPNSPTTSGTYTSFEAPTNSGDNFGLRMWGYICPPTTGSYTFWIASDDNAELWLSTTNSAANRVRIAYHTSYTGVREWNKIATQKSLAITLNAGQLYFVEAIMKDGTQGDNLAVGWAKPGQATTTPSEVIPGTQLRTSLPDAQAPTAATNLTAAAITATSFTLGWTASTDNIAVTGYDIYQNGVKINTANVTTTSFAVTGLTAATAYNYYVIAKDAAGNLSANSNTLLVTTAAPDTQAPTAPTGLVASIITQTSFTLNWTAATDNNAVTGYDVYRNGIKINTANITATTYNVTGLTASTTYQFTVKAKDAAANESAASSALSVATLDNTAAVETFTQRTVIANQRMPHDLVYGPDGNIWYTERFGGTVSFVNPATSVKRVVLTLGTKLVKVGGQDGLMGLALHPQFRQGKPYVYISYSYQSVSTTVRKIRIERYTYDSVARTLGAPVTVLENIPGSNDHNSARLAIGPDLKLYFSIGDMGAGQFDNSSRTNNAQNLNVYEGKILRLNTELIGSSWIPTDNPFTNAGVPTAVYSYGHRNPQGLVWGNVNGSNILYSSEHGPYSDDELNIIQPATNYGWPLVAGFCDNNYNGRYIGGVLCVNESNNCNTLNAKEPIRSLFPAATPGDSLVSNMTWPSTAPSGTEFYGSNGIPGWQNSLLVAMLKTGTVTRFKLSSDGLSIISDTIHYFRGKGRFRDVVVSPDGLKIYVSCDSSGSTSGPTGGVVSTPANAGSILEFTYQPPVSGRSAAPLITEATIEATIEEEKTNKSVDVYPNPASSFFVVYNYNKDAAFNIDLIDMSGRTVKRSSTKGVATRVDVSGLSGGLYILKLTDANGKIIRTEKIVVKN